MAWWASAVPAHHVSTWSEPEDRAEPVSWEFQKDPIMISGKATGRGLVMSLLRITLLIAFLDV